MHLMQSHATRILITYRICTCSQS